MRKAPTLADIAEMAGVTKSTVSRVLNNVYSINIPDATRERILQIASELQYQPNAAARSLTTRSTQTIGLYVRAAQRLRDLHLQAVISGISEAVVDNDASLIWYFGESSNPSEISFTSLYDGRVDAGIILEDRGTTPAVLQQAASQARIPLVFIGNYKDSKAHFIGSDDYSGAKAAAHHLADYGHREILCIGAVGTTAGEQRVTGFREGLSERGLEADSLFIDTDFRPALAYQAVKEIYAQRKAPTAVFAVNDLSALAALQAIVESGRRVPDDVSVVGFNNLSFTSFCQPALTTVHRPLYDMGVEAVRLIMRLLAEKEPAPQAYQMILPSKLVVRASTGPAAGVKRDMWQETAFA